MNKQRTEDDIMTYNPNYTREYYDSSEFGDHGDEGPYENLLIKQKVIKKVLTKKQVLKKANRCDKTLNIDQTATQTANALSTLCHHCKCIIKYTPGKTEDGGSQGVSKSNLTKKLSSVFHRSNRKTVSIIEEKDSRVINSKRVYCPDCRQRQIRKFYRKQQVYKAANTADVVIPQPPQAQVFEANRTHFSNTNTVYAGEIKMRKRKVYRYRGDCDLDKKKQMRLTNRSQQYSGFAVYNSQCCQKHKEGTSNACCKMPQVPSFWEFMFNKLSAKYQEALNLATCEDCKPVNCAKAYPVNSKAAQSHGTSETQTEQLCETKCGVLPCQKNSENQTQTDDKKCRRASLLDLFPSPRTSRTTSPTNSKKLNSPLSSKSSEPNHKCKCPSKYSDKVHNKPLTKLTFPDNSKSCQLSHDGLNQALKDKYNGEVLCIHNPPCILINGCVNLPHQAPKPLDIWQITTARRKADPKTNHRLEICQLPSIEVQSQPCKQENPLCNHGSPCEVVPICFNSQSSPDYVGPCEHDPMCSNVPVCMIETEQKITRFSCEHVPLCAGIPGSFRVSEQDGSAKLDQVSSVSDGSTQVERPLQLMCPHKPPCIMIPKCLGPSMLIRKKSGAIPDCMHKPACEYIPACGRNYVKMLAACSCSITPRPQCRIT